MDGSSSSAPGALPRRQAAQAARTIFVEQLDSDSHSGGSGAEGAAGKRKARARSTSRAGTAAKTRKRAVTLRGDAQGGGAMGPASTASGGLTPKPKLKSTSSVPGPHAAEGASGQPRPRPRPVAKKMSTLAPLVVPAPLDLDDLSDLTPLSSAGVSAFSDTGEAFKGTASTSTLVPPPPRSQNKTKPGREAKKARWTAASLGTYVWVLIEYKTWRVYDEDYDEDDRDYLWWPGRIASTRHTDIPLKVKLFGLGTTTVSIGVPSKSNVLPKDQDYVQRFLVPTYVPPIPFSSASSRAREREKETIGDKWRSAVDAMTAHQRAVNQDCETDSDDFPEAINNMFDFLTAPSTSFKSISAPIKPSSSKIIGEASSGSKKRKRAADSEASTDEDHTVYVTKKKDKTDEWWDEVDEELKLPGELVLGRTAQSVDIDHWPGKLIDYIPPTKPKTFGKYSVMWLDGTQGLIPRAWFYSTDQDEFASCKLGQFDSSVVEVQNDDDDDTSEPAHELAQRLLSPTPLDSPPPGSQFALLPIRDQFVYTKGVLRAILKNEYAPIRERQARYMKGGRHRQSLVDGASLRGKMDPRDVNDLLAFIREWCLRDGGRAGALSGDNDVIVSERGVNEIKNSEDEVAVEPASEDATAGDGMRVLSPSPTVGFPSSPLQMPPSSFPSSALEREASVISILSDVEGEKESAMSITTDTEPGTGARTYEATDENNTGAIPGSSAFDIPSARPRQQGSRDFELLSDLEKVDYCLNILLPEAVRQILLWRSGSRISVERLSPAEEQDLYEEGTKLLEETDWVNDVIRYRKGLQMILSKGKVPETSGREKGRGTRSRRNIVKPNYQE